MKLESVVSLTRNIAICQRSELQTTRMIRSDDKRVVEVGYGAPSLPGLLRFWNHSVPNWQDLESIKPSRLAGLLYCQFQIFSVVHCCSHGGVLHLEAPEPIPGRCELCMISSHVKKTCARRLKETCMCWERSCLPRVSPRSQVVHGNSGGRLHVLKYSLEMQAVEFRAEAAYTSTGTTGGTMCCEEKTSPLSESPMRLPFDGCTHSGVTDSARNLDFLSPVTEMAVAVCLSNGARILPSAKIYYFVDFTRRK